MDIKIEDLMELLRRRKIFLENTLKKEKFGYKIENEIKKSLKDIKTYEKHLYKKIK